MGYCGVGKPGLLGVPFGTVRGLCTEWSEVRGGFDSVVS